MSDFAHFGLFGLIDISVLFNGYSICLLFNGHFLMANCLEFNGHFSSLNVIFSVIVCY